MTEWAGFDWDFDCEIGECDHCHKTDRRVKYTVDPYIEELYPEDDNEECMTNWPSWWCHDCWENRHDDV